MQQLVFSFSVNCQQYFRRAPFQMTYMEQAQLLRDAMKGAGTDENLIINIATQYNWVEREQIAKDFVSQFGLELSQQLKKELSFNFENLMIGLFKNRHQFWAQQIYNAISGAGTNEKRLITLILLMSDADVEETSIQYEKMYNKELFKAVVGDISNSDWGKLLKGWLKGQHEANIDHVQAADDIYKASRKTGTDEDVFLRILCNTSHECYGKIVQQYQQKYGTSINQLIKEEFAMRSEFAFLLAHEYLLNPFDAVQLILKQSVVGAGTDDKMVIDLTVLFADYFKGKLDIGERLKKDLSGDYKAAVLKLWKVE
uniref:Annexin 9 n=1 Tax=Trepomonas sp. PC1 TaxID=1076344 RepID=A0A146K9G6_9EUKA|eukprot:JAP93227.1 Annexin 9 [Trepomonas sp. PC1]